MHCQANNFYLRAASRSFIRMVVSAVRAVSRQLLGLISSYAHV